MEHGVVELLSQWRRDIDAPAAASLCTALADAGEREPGTLDEAMVLSIGRELESRFPTDASLLIAVGRMYMACGALKRAIKPLALAANGPEPEAAYTLLGELLLRVGDARRSVLSFERAMATGANGSALAGWLSTARSYVGLQDEQGAGAVAAEVERAIATTSAKGIADPPTIELPREDTGRTEILPRRPLPSYVEPLTAPQPHVRVATWGDDPTEVTPMHRIVAERGDVVTSDDDPTAVLDADRVLALHRDMQACKSAELEPTAPLRSTPPPLPVVHAPAPARRAEPVAPVTNSQTKPAVAAPKWTPRPDPKLPASSGPLLPVTRAAALPATSGPLLPVARAGARPARPALPSPTVVPSVAPVRRRRGSVARPLGVVALLAIAATAVVVVTGRPGLIDAFARGALGDATPAALEAPRAPAETDAPAASSAPAEPNEARADRSAEMPAVATTAPPTPDATTAGAAGHAPKPPVAGRPLAAPATASAAMVKPKPAEKEAPAKPEPTAEPPSATPIWAGDPELRGQ